MSSKKKTVKELNDVVDILENRIKELENKVEVCECKDKVNQLEKRLNEMNKMVESLTADLNDFKENETEEIRASKSKCGKCDLSFESKKKLKEHFKNSHKRELKCAQCEKTFEEHWKFEKHLKEHGKSKEFKCESCDGTFYTEWRLKMHTKSHEDGDIKFCHYFNNFKVCPYEELGCMFKHAESMNCKYRDRCNNRLCQFRHQNSFEVKRKWKCDEQNWENESCEFQTEVELRLKNHIFGEHEIGEYFICDDCEFRVKERSSMVKHIEKDHGKVYETCNGNCSDRMYEENSFTCGKCESFLCIICSKTEISETSELDPELSYCSACANE